MRVYNITSDLYLAACGLASVVIRFACHATTLIYSVCSVVKCRPTAKRAETEIGPRLRHR